LWSSRDSSATHLVPAPSKITTASLPASLNSFAVINALTTRPSPSRVSVSAKTMLAALATATSRLALISDRSQARTVHPVTVRLTAAETTATEAGPTAAILRPQPSAIASPGAYFLFA
jgi:hypothetical protein